MIQLLTKKNLSLYRYTLNKPTGEDDIYKPMVGKHFYGTSWKGSWSVILFIINIKCTIKMLWKKWNIPH